MKARPSPLSISRQVTLLRAEAVHKDLAGVLDALDAWGLMDRLRLQLPPLFTWGPKVLKGLAPTPWVGVVIWQRGPGYTGFRTLTLHGLWTRQIENAPHVIVGKRYLPYQAPFYEAEAYHQLIRKGFEVYYHDEGGPPSGEIVAEIPYVPEERLMLRERLLALLIP